MCTCLTAHPVKHWPEVLPLYASVEHYGLPFTEWNSGHAEGGLQKSFPSRGPVETTTISVQRT